MRTNAFATIVMLGSFAAVASGQNDHHQHGSSSKPAAQASSSAGAAVIADSETGPHGGLLSATEGLQVETLISLGGVRLFAYSAQGDPVDLSTARGVAVLQIEGKAKKYRHDLYPETVAGQQASLVASADLSRVGGSRITISYQLAGVPGSDRRGVKFVVNTTAPLTESQQVALAIEKQKVCPVSNQPLGSMGKPIAVKVEGQALYVCCKGCIVAVQAEPKKYLAMVSGSAGVVPAGGEEVRPGVYKVTAADQPFVAAQKKCPVMDEPLDGMGGPYKVHADGKAIYICCPGCAKRIIVEPTKYLQVLAEQGVTAPALKKASAVAPAPGEEVRPGVFKVTAADQPFVAAQKTCPVMDEPLDGMGGPYRMVADGRVVYLCCPGCAKRLQADPQEYLEKLAAAGVEPPATR